VNAVHRAVPEEVVAIDGKPSNQYRLYIGSIGTDIGRFARAVRGYWGIENNLHWSLDVAFREDESRLRDPQSRENFAVLRNMALSRLKNDKWEKRDIKNKRFKAGWDRSTCQTCCSKAGDATLEPSITDDANIGNG
jgi:hypothetical protein